MANLNVVCLSGNLTRDPELKTLPSGTSLCNMRLAVNERFKDSNGEWRDKPFYFDVTAWGARGEVSAQYLQKGSGVIIRGRLQWREWEQQDGTKRQAVDVVADEVIFMPKGDGGGQRQTRTTDSGQQGSYGAPAEPAAAGYGVPTARPADDDDIPF